MRLAAAALLLAATGASAQPQGDAAETTVRWSASELDTFSGDGRHPAPWKSVRVGDETIKLSIAPLWWAVGREYSGDYLTHLDVVAAGHYDGLTPDQVTRRQADARAKSRYGFAIVACIDDPDRSRYEARKELQLRVESTTAGTDPTPWVPWDPQRKWRQLRPAETLSVASCNFETRFQLYFLERNATWISSIQGAAARAFPVGVTLRISAGPPPPPSAAPAPPPVVAEPARPLPSLVVRSPEAEQAAAQRAADAEAARRGEATQRALADIARSREEAARRQAEAQARAAAAQAEYERKKREHEAALARNRAAQEEYRRKCEAVRAKGGSCVIER